MSATGVGSGAGAGSGSDVPVFRKADPGSLSPGDVLGCREYYKVLGVTDTKLHLCTIDGAHESHVSKAIIQNEYFAVNVREGEERVTATRLVEVLANTHGLPVRVGFFKQQNDKRLGEMLEALTPDDLPGKPPEDESSEPAAAKRERNKRRRRLVKYAKRMGQGTLRILTGRVLTVPTGATSTTGARFTMEDFFIPGNDPSARARQVDTRTLQFIDIGARRYVRKDYKGPLDGSGVPRFHGELDIRDIDA